MSLLEVRHLRKSFGGVHAVQGVSLDLAAGEVLALIGPTARARPRPSRCSAGNCGPTPGACAWAGAT